MHLLGNKYISVFIDYRKSNGINTLNINALISLLLLAGYVQDYPFLTVFYDKSKTSRQSPNVHASMPAWLVARGNKSNIFLIFLNMDKSLDF